MCELALAIRHRMLESYADTFNPTPGLIDHMCMSAGESAIEALVRCGLSDGRFRQASIADERTCADFEPSAEQERALAHALFDLEVMQHEALPDGLAVFHPPERLRSACERLAARDDLVAKGDGFAWPLDRLTVFRRGFLHQGPLAP